MKWPLVVLCLLMAGCKNDLNSVNTSIYYHTVTFVSSSNSFQTTTVTYQLGDQNGGLPLGSKTFFDVVPGTHISLTVTGYNSPPAPNTPVPPPGLVTATIYVDEVKWQTSYGAGQTNASATADGVIP